MGRRRKDNSTVEEIPLNSDEQKKVKAIDEQIQSLKERRKKEISKAMDRVMKEREAAFGIMENAIESILDRKLDTEIAVKISNYLSENAEAVVVAVLGEAADVSLDQKENIDEIINREDAEVSIFGAK